MKIQHQRGYRMLEKIKSPQDIKQLSMQETEMLCAEMREVILQTVSQNGGHLGSNLGIVEATLALHKKFNSPEDKIIFDVGHQCYPHKLLTGRYEKFSTLRTLNGVSGFPNRSESEHDILNEGHCGTSLSAALGIATANKLRGSDAYTIAVVGDGALTNGMIYEALNNCADKDLNLIILINDNEMSISKNIGGLHAYLSRIRTSRKYFRLKRGMEKVLLHIPLIGRGLAVGFKHIKDFCKLLFVKNNIFEDLGILYLGPVDGHNMKKLDIVLDEAIAKHKCCIVHMNTVKGKGYEHAEKEPDKYHGVSPFDREQGISQGSGAPTFTSVVSEMLCEKAQTDERLCAITAAMRDGTGLSTFAEKYPERFFDVGIAEEHAVTYAAGLARGGMKPVLALYSTFAQRSYDQFLHDVAIQRLPFVLLLDRAGLVPGDGLTHQGIFDYPLLSSVPNVKIYSPETYDETRNIFEKAYASEDFSVIRYPKGAQKQYSPAKKMMKCGDCLEYSEGIEKADTVIVTYGRITSVAHEAIVRLAEPQRIGILKLVQIFPLDMENIMSLIGNAKRIYFLEEGYRFGGVSEKLSSALHGEKKVEIHAIEGFVEHGNMNELFDFCGFTAENVAKRIMDMK